MGSGSWSDKDFVTYSCSLGRTVDLATGSVTGTYSNQEIFRATKISEDLNPYKAVRECRDTIEHPNTVPVILALDVTGSLGDTAVEVAKTLNVVITELYKSVKDLEIMIMGIGDMAYDHSPLQVSQFESDIRIAEQLDKLYFEFGGGGNEYESYSLAWYFALNHTKIDAIEKRGKKAIIITMGDEKLNPYIPKRGYRSSFVEDLGDTLQDDVSTKDLYTDVKDKFDCYHIHVDHKENYGGYSFDNVKDSYINIIGEDHLYHADINSISSVITNIVTMAANSMNCVTTPEINVTRSESGEIVW